MENTKNMVARIPGLLDWSTGEARIMSAKCNSCGTHFFPKEHFQHRPGCSREGVEDVLLSNKGTLATYTIQYYECPPPFKTEKPIAPYGVGMVEFPEGIQIAGLIMETDLKTLKIGMPMETFAYTLYKNEEKQDVVTWAFRAIKK